MCVIKLRWGLEFIKSARILWNVRMEILFKHCIYWRSLSIVLLHVDSFKFAVFIFSNNLFLFKKNMLKWSHMLCVKMFRKINSIWSKYVANSRTRFASVNYDNGEFQLKWVANRRNPSPVTGRNRKKIRKTKKVEKNRKEEVLLLCLSHQRKRDQRERAIVWTLRIIHLRENSPIL